MENINTGNMTERYCALIVGILFLILGLAGFIVSESIGKYYIALGTISDSPFAFTLSGEIRLG